MNGVADETEEDASLMKHEDSLAWVVLHMRQLCGLI